MCDYNYGTKRNLIKFVLEVLLAIQSKRTLGSTFKKRLRFIRCDSILQEELRAKLQWWKRG